MNSDRRKFFYVFGSWCWSYAFPNFVEDFENLEPVNSNSRIDPKDLSNWFKKIKGEHRVVYDGSQPHNTLPIVWNWAFLESNNSVGVKDSNITAITVLRHSGIVFAFNSETWKSLNLENL